MRNYFSFFKSRKSGIISSIVHFHKVCTGLSGNAHLHILQKYSLTTGFVMVQGRDWLAHPDNLGSLSFV